MFKKRKDKVQVETPKVKWSLYGRVWREVGKPQWKWLAVGILCTIAAAGAEAYTITLVKQVIDSAFIERSMTSLYVIGLQVVLAFGLKGSFNYAQSLIMTRAGLLGAFALNKKIYAHTVKMDIGSFYGSGVAVYQNYFNLHAKSVLSLVTTVVVDFIKNVATLIMMFGVMMWYAPEMFLVLMFLVPAIFIPIMLIMRRKRRLTALSFGIADTIGQQLNQTMYGMKTIQSFANGDTELKRYTGQMEFFNNNMYKQTQAAALQSPLLELMISIGLCLALILGGKLIVDGVLSVGDFTAFLLALTAAYKPAKGITSVNTGLQAGLMSAEALFNFLDSAPKIVDKPGAVPLKSDNMNVSFKNVTFAYNATDGDVLRGVNLEVPAGTVCAFVGPSGGGKTTMFNLIERFYEPQKGTIEINGKDIQSYTMESLRKNISEVSQDVFLFNDSIINNIKYGAPNASMEDVIRAAKMANAHDFIMEFPNGYENSVGERGVLLSGGQKQRIAIARAILKDAPILLLDEATSALDTKSEKLIQSALNELMKGRTTFVIAHRLSTIFDADQICVIKDGQIVERGTDSELNALNGEYTKLRNAQFKE